MASRFKEIKPVIKWLIIGPVRQSRWRVLSILCFQGLGTALQVAGFAVLVKFINLILGDWTIEFFDFSHDFSQIREPVFWSVFGLTVFFLMTGAFFDLLARRRTATLARITEEKAVYQIARNFVHFFRELNKVFPGASPATIKSFYSRGGRYLGRMAMAITSSLVPLLMMFISLGFLFYLKPGLTSFLLMLLALALPLFVKTAAMGRKASDDLMKQARSSTVEKSNYIDQLRLSVFLPDLPGAAEIRRLNNSPATAGFMDAYEQRLRITALSTFFTQSVIVVMLIAVLLATVYPALQGHDFSLTSTLIYIIAFKFFGSGLVAMMNTYVTLNVFYSYCRDMVPFLEERKTENLPCHPEKQNMPEKNIIAPEFAFAPGEPVLVNFYAAPDWSNIGFILCNLEMDSEALPDNPLQACRLLSMDTPFRPEDLSGKADDLPDMTGKELLQKLKALTVSDKYLRKQMKHVEAGSFFHPGWNNISPEIKMLVKALVLSRESGPLRIFVDGTGFIKMPTNLREMLLNILKEHYVFVVVPGDFKYRYIGDFFFKVVICLNQEGVQWIGPYSRAKKENITIGQYVGDESAADDVTELFDDM